MFNASAGLLLKKEYHKAYDTQKWSLYRKASDSSHLAHPLHLPCLTISDFPPIRAMIMWFTTSILTTERKGISMAIRCHQHDFGSMILPTPSSWLGIMNRPSKCASGASPKACALVEDIHSKQFETGRLTQVSSPCCDRAHAFAGEAKAIALRFSPYDGTSWRPGSRLSQPIISCDWTSSPRIASSGDRRDIERHARFQAS